jgi:glycosyltransferase involved in cell wall biosynthesis
MAADFFLVIPAFREAQRLPPFLGGLVKLLAAEKFSTEILIVDDGSPRAEQEALRDALQIGTFGKCRVLGTLFLPENKGKGHAIMEGWRFAEGAAWVGFVDADGGAPAEEVVRLLEWASTCPIQPPPCLWAARVRMLGRKTNRTQGRYLLGRLFANIASAMIGLPVYDTQCGFKLVPSVHYRKIAPLLKEKRFCFDIELLLALHHAAAPVMEIPIDWRDVPGGHVHALRDGLAMLLRLTVIRRRAWRWPRVT